MRAASRDHHREDRAPCRRRRAADGERQALRGHTGVALRLRLELRRRSPLDSILAGSAGFSMPARILDGKIVAERLTGEVRERVAARVASGLPAPGLAVVLVGENAASQIYVRNKRRTTDVVGMRSFAVDWPATVPEAELLSSIDRLNADPSVSGIWCSCRCPPRSTPSASSSASTRARTWMDSIRTTSGVSLSGCRRCGPARRRAA